MSGNAVIKAPLGAAAMVAKRIDEAPWHPRQILVLFLTALTVLLDGIDNHALGLALPNLAADWGVSNSELAPIVAVGLFGMAVGSIIGGPLADRIGRKPVLLAAVGIFGLATLASVFAVDVVTLGILRGLVGFGMGATVPTAAALVAESTPARHQAFAVGVAMLCVPVGGIVASVVAAHILPWAGWKGVFVFGGVMPLLLCLILPFLLSESPCFLALKPSRRKERDRILRQWGIDAVVEPAEAETAAAAPLSFPLANLFAAGLRRDTVGFWGAFLLGLVSAYGLANWLPSTLVAGGLDQSSASLAMSFFLIGAIAVSVATTVGVGLFGSRAWTLLLALGGASAAAGMTFVERTQLDAPLIGLLMLLGGCVAAFQIALVTVGANIYPTEARAAGIGAGMTVGRVGAILSSFVIGALIDLGGNQNLYLWFLVGTMSCAVVFLLAIRRHVPRAQTKRAGSAAAGPPSKQAS